MPNETATPTNNEYRINYFPIGEESVDGLQQSQESNEFRFTGSRPTRDYRETNMTQAAKLTEDDSKTGETL